MDKEARLLKYLQEHPEAEKLFIQREEHKKDILKKKHAKEERMLIRKKLYAELRAKGYTLEAIGKSEGITRERVRQILLGK